MRDTVRITRDSNLGNFIIGYLSGFRDYKRRLGSEDARFFGLIMEYWLSSGSVDFETKLRPYLLSLIEKKKITSPEQIFDEKPEGLLAYMMDEKNAALCRYYLSHLMEHPFSGYDRRPCRSKKLEYYLSDAIDILEFFFIFSAAHTTIEKFLKGDLHDLEEEIWNGSFIKHWWAVHIMKDNKKVVEYLKDALSNEGKAALLTREQYCGIVMSGNQELIGLMAKLLVSPKLKEASRKVIIVTLGVGSFKTFAYFLNVISESPKLQQLSYVKKQMAYWIGLDDRSASKHMTEELIAYTAKILNDKKFSQSMLKSKKAFDYYMALLVLSFHSIEEVFEMGDSIIQGSERERVQAFFIFIGKADDREVNQKFSKKALVIWHQDPEVLATFAMSYMSGASYYSWLTLEEARPSLESCFDSLAEARSQYELLKSLYQRLKSNVSFPSPVFPCRKIILRPSDIINLMCSIAYVARIRELLDDVCGYLHVIGPYSRADFLERVLNKPISPIQVATVIKGLGDVCPDTREVSSTILRKMSLSEASCLAIEEMLVHNYADARPDIVKLLIKSIRYPHKMAELVKRLLTDTNVGKRLGGLAVMLEIKGSKTYKKVFEESLPLLTSIYQPSLDERKLISLLSEKTSFS